MTKFERMERRRAMLRTVISCTGWGLLGYVLMKNGIGPFWVGWGLQAAALCVGVWTMDKYMADGKYRW